LAAFRQGLSETGLVDGKDFTIEFRWAEGDYERLRGMAHDLVARNVSVIIAAGGVASAPVAKAATATIPIVFITGADPVATGLVTSLARPEANVTGVSFLTQALGAKRLGLLNILAPDARTVAVLLNPTNPGRNFVDKEIQDAGRVSEHPDIRGKHRTRNRFCFRSHQSPEARRDLDLFRSLFHQQRSSNRCARHEGWCSSDLSVSRVCRGRRTCILRRGCQRGVPQSRRLCRQAATGRQAGGSADCSADQVRVGDQSQDRTFDRIDHSGFIPVARRRGDRMRPPRPTRPPARL
jgi:ABC transporter substrate binding protein